ncbi:MAG TPA: hypothetical protein VKX25_05400 [Bryobacteraceae bacterium]|jgi:hypothetical protein|nr:hypothetical protein [Bryobacteraceae bacterium]
MAAPQSVEIQTVEEIAVLVTASLFLKRPFSAIYNECRRSLCPYVLGRSKEGDLRLLCYQYAGRSSSGLAPCGSPENWRCIVLGKLRSVRMLNEPWITLEQHTRPQTCIAKVLFDTEKLPQ